ncbi:SDR family oxidoreductase [Microvirga sp. W0021]|uniref:SDR family oxidoreductase n=1 Tax=Hohaiivirga grylli TaxID=3133970 RepID=A0ABV0BGP6_9HYPH
MTIDPPKLFIFGMGYSSLCFIELYGHLFSEIAGTVRSVEKAQQLQRFGIRALSFDDPMVSTELADAGVVLSSIPPLEGHDPVLEQFGSEMAQLKQGHWFGYLSTTGVYGDRDGEWTDEETEISPVSAHSKDRAQIEQLWLDWGAKHHKAVHIFRLTGIYGPGRNPLENLLRGRAQNIIKEGQVFNRIHVEDICGTLMASIKRPNAGRIYNVSDDEPAPMQDVIRYAAELMDVNAPAEVPFDKAELSPMGRSFYSENKRICNKRIKEELGVELRYPTYRDGLKAMWDVMSEK